MSFWYKVRDPWGSGPGEAQVIRTHVFPRVWRLRSHGAAGFRAALSVQPLPLLTWLLLPTMAGDGPKAPGACAEVPLHPARGGPPAFPWAARGLCCGAGASLPAWRFRPFQTAPFDPLPTFPVSGQWVGVQLPGPWKRGSRLCADASASFRKQLLGVTDTLL